MLSTKLKEAAGNSADATLYVDDVFSTYPYTGNGSTQTITNGIDLAGKGGMVWAKARSNSSYHGLSGSDFATSYFGGYGGLRSDQTAALGSTDFSGVSSTGFNLAYVGGDMNTSGWTYASWTFRKAAKFFDVVTYTGTGSARTIAHSLGVVPGMIIVKSLTNSGSSWRVWHNSFAATDMMILNSTAAKDAGGATAWNSTAPSATEFTLGTFTQTNASGESFVAYLFAHDTAADGIIQCGSYVGTGSTTTINLGWEPQYVMVKLVIDPAGNGPNPWVVMDSMRGLGKSYDNALCPNTANSEAADVSVSGALQLTATGFQLLNANGALNVNTDTYIYMAIRMPNKPPTTGTQVFTNSLANPSVSVSCGFVPDMAFSNTRTSTGGVYTGTRLQGNSVSLNTYNAAAESAFGWVWNGISTTWMQTSLGSPVVDWIFARSPAFMDIVCYTGTGSATTQAHNLTVAPELMMVKERSAANVWWVYDAINGNTKYMGLNSTAVPTTSATAWNNTTPTASVFSIGTATNVNASTQTYVAYLFATLAGISKVGSYTGNGTGQAIACGFSAGARFVLIKRTDSTGNWYTFDSARGLTSGSSPYLLLNSNAAEVTGNNGVYASTGGFTLGSTASTTTNISGASYIFLAVS